MTISRFTRLILGTNLVGTDNGDGTLTVDATGGGGGVVELDYTEITSNATVVTATTEGTAETIISAGAVALDGSTRICIEFFCGRIGNSGATSAVSHFVLYDDTGGGAASIGLWGQGTLASLNYPVHLLRFLTPSNATHTFSVRGFYEQGGFTVYAGAGGSGNQVPAFLRITEA